MGSSTYAPLRPRSKILNVLDLFSGIGGFSLGLERAGMQTVAFCECEPFCQSVLRRHWPEVPIYDDVKTLTAERLTADGITVDLICGGFPCQDISVAGKGAGISGSRSGLWMEYARLIGELKPAFAIIENVPRLRTLGADRVLADLEELRYACEPIVVGAIHAGAPHKRLRAWLVAHAIGGQLRQQPGRRSGPRRAKETFATQHGTERSMAEPAESVGQREGWPRRSSGVDQGIQDTAGTLADTNSEQMERPSIARAQCRPWDVEPDVGRVVDGLPAILVEDELRALGNAVIPQIPEAIGRAIQTAIRCGMT